MRVKIEYELKSTAHRAKSDSLYQVWVEAIELNTGIRAASFSIESPPNQMELFALKEDAKEKILSRVKGLVEDKKTKEIELEILATEEFETDF